MNAGNPETVLVSGHARLPNESAAKAVYEILSVTVEAETRNWTVVAVDVTLITNCARNFLHRKILGRRLDESPDALIADLELTFHGGAKKAVLAAVKDLYKQAEQVKTLLET